MSNIVLQVSATCFAEAAAAPWVQGKELVSLAAAKRHTVVLTADGDVYTWGHRVVTPRRVGLAGARDVSRASPTAPPLAFHKGQTDVSRPRAVRIAAGAAHTSCLTQVRGHKPIWSTTLRVRVHPTAMWLRTMALCSATDWLPSGADI